MIKRCRILPISLCILVLMLFAGSAFAGHGHGNAESKTGVLLVTFGTTVPKAQIDLAKMDEAVKKAFPKMDIRWAYTAKIVRDKVLKEQGMKLQSPSEALAAMKDEGFTDIAVQSLHVIPGAEFHDLLRTVQGFRTMGLDIAVGLPLLGTTDDYPVVTEAALKQGPAKQAEGQYIVFMGHGTHHPAGIAYPAMQYFLDQTGRKVLMGTVEGVPAFDDVLAVLKAEKASSVVLLPFMSVAGDHAMNDMAGNEKDSWASMLMAEGFKVESLLKGMAGDPALQAVWIKHLKAALGKLK